MKLRYLSGPCTGKTVSIPAAGLVLGRDDECDIMLAGEGLSRRHASIQHLPQGYVLRDLESTNGVRVNGDRVKEPRTLMAGDRIGLGDQLLLFTDDNDILPEDQLAVLCQAGSHRLRQERAGRRRILWLCLGLLVLLALVAGIAAIPLRQRHQALAKPPPPPGTAAPAASSAGAPEDSGGGLAPARPPARPATAPVPRFLYLVVESNPAGARVEWNGQARGQAPTVLRQLAPGPGELRLTLDGYEPLRQTVNTSDSQNPGAFRLEPAKGNVLLQSDPDGAAVYRGSQVLGRTPLLLREVAPGDQRWRCELPGYAPRELRLTVRPDKGARGFATLEPIVGRIALAAAPPGVEVLLDGQSVGVVAAPLATDEPPPPLLLDGIAPGAHTLALRRDGQMGASRTVNLGKGETLSLRLAWE